MSEEDKALITATLAYLYGVDVPIRAAFERLVAERNAALYGTRNGDFLTYNGERYFVKRNQSLQGLFRPMTDEERNRLLSIAQ